MKNQSASWQEREVPKLVNTHRLVPRRLVARMALKQRSEGSEKGKKLYACPSWRQGGFPWSGGQLLVVRSHSEDRSSALSGTRRGLSQAAVSVPVPQPAEWRGRNPRLSSSGSRGPGLVYCRPGNCGTPFPRFPTRPHNRRVFRFPGLEPELSR